MIITTIHLGSTLRAMAVAPKVFPPTTRLPDSRPSNRTNPDFLHFDIFVDFDTFLHILRLYTCSSGSQIGVKHNFIVVDDLIFHTFVLQHLIKRLGCHCWRVNETILSPKGSFVECSLKAWKRKLQPPSPLSCCSTFLCLGQFVFGPIFL